MGLISDLDELGANPHAVACPPEAAFQNVGHPQLATDLIHALLGLFVLHCRSSGDNAKLLRMHTAELGDHFLGEAVAQVFLPRIPGEVLEGQHRQHDLVGGRDRVSRESELGEVPYREQGRNQADDRDPEASGADSAGTR